MFESMVVYPSTRESTLYRAGEGVFETLPEIIGDENPSSVYFMTDKNVDSFHARWISKVGRSKEISAQILTLPAGERTKNTRHLMGVANWLLENGADRDSIIVAIGGGVVTDLVGFAAATFMRGVRHVLVPTTLLAQVDAAIGGKTGVNLPAAKNSLGVVKQPVATLADPGFLHTLKVSHLREGLSELVKAALIRSRKLAGLLETVDPGNSTTILSIASELVETGMKVKVGVVRKDPREKDLRRILNFGHTVGHSIESLLGYKRMTHGKAIAFGMLVALYLSRNLLGLDDETVEWGEDTIGRLHGRFDLGGINYSHTWNSLKNDKKRFKGRPRFVLLRAFAEPEILEVDINQFRKAFGEASRKWNRV